MSYDETRLFGMLSRIDERTTITQKQLVNIFERLGNLEKKSPTCPHHESLMKAVSSTQIDVKVNDVKIVFVTTGLTTFTVLFLTWVINSIPIA